MIIKAFRIFSGLSHLTYGILTLSLSYYIEEFERFGFSKFRVLIALVQIICGIGLLLPLNNPKIILLSAAVLALMMGGALFTRMSINDNFVQSMPALIYFLVNSWIFMKTLKKPL
jgi:hypothetical protein